MFAGRGLSYWVGFLEHPRLSVRLMALRALASLGATEELLESTLSHPVLAWALVRAGNFEALQAHRSREVVRLACFLMLRTRRKRPAAGHSLKRCLAGLRAARHPLTAFAWACRVVELYGLSAIPDLVDVLLHRGARHEPCEAAAWALGQLGPPVVRELTEALRQPSRGTRFWVCQVAWYLGSDARALEGQLERFLPDPAAEAALLAMGRGGWLSEEEVARLAERLFGFDSADRVAAARALNGFGPELDRVPKLLGQFVCDPDPDVRLAVVETLVALGMPVKEYLLPAVLDTRGEVVAVARAYLLEQPDYVLGELQSQDPIRARSAIKLMTAETLSRLPFADRVALLQSPAVEVRRKLAWSLSGHSEAIRPLLTDPDPEVRCTAAQALTCDPDSMEGLRALLDDDVPEVYWAAARALLESGTALDVERILRSPGPRVLSWLKDLAVTRQAPPDAIREALKAGLLDHPQVLEALGEWVTPACEPALFRAAGQSSEAARLWCKLVPFERVLEVLASPDEELRMRVARGLGSVVTHQRAGEVPIDDPSASVRDTVARNLVKFITPDSPHLPRWVAAASSILAVEALGHLRERWRNAAPTRIELEAVGRALTHEEHVVRLVASNVLAELPGLQPAGVLAQIDDLTELLLSWLQGEPLDLVIAALGLVSLLWDLRPVEELLAGVTPCLQSPELSVRVAAARCLAGAPAELAVPLLEPLLADESLRPTIREVLAELRSWEHFDSNWSDPAVASLLLGHRRLPPDLADKLRAGQNVSESSLLLAHSLLPTDEERSVLADCFRNAHPVVREEFLRCVAGYGVTGLEALLIVQQTAGEDGDLRAAAGRGLATLLGRAAGGLEWVLGRLEDLDWTEVELLEAVGSLLRNVGPFRLPDLVAMIAPLVDSSHDRLAAAAVTALGRAGEAGSLRAALKRPSPLVRKAALEALLISEIRWEFFDEIREMAGSDPDEEVRALAARTLPAEPRQVPTLSDPLQVATLIEDLDQNRDLIVAGLSSEDQEVRIAFADLLERRRTYWPEAIPVWLEQEKFQLLPGSSSAYLDSVRQALAHPHADVRRGAVRYLARVKDERAEPTLIDMARSDASAQVRDAAREALRILWVHLPPWLWEGQKEFVLVGLERARKLWALRPNIEVLAAVKPCLDSEHAPVREAAVAALGAGPPELVRPLLDPLLDDPDVSLDAAEALAQMGFFEPLDPRWREFWGVLGTYGRVPPTLLVNLRAGREVEPAAMSLCQLALPPHGLFRLLVAAYPNCSAEDRAVLLRNSGLPGLEALLEFKSWSEMAELLLDTPAGLEWLVARQDALELEQLASCDGLFLRCEPFRALRLVEGLRRLAECSCLALANRARTALEEAEIIAGQLEALDHRWPATRLDALKALGRQNLEDTGDNVYRRIALCARDETDLEVRREAIRLLERMDGHLYQGLGGSDLAFLITRQPDLWYAADLSVQLDLAGLLDDVSQHVEIVARGLQSEHEPVRFAFADLLVRQGAFLPEAVPVFLEKNLGHLLTGVAREPLRSALDHPYALVRHRAAEALGQCRDLESRARLAQMAQSDPDPMARQIAREALADLG